MKNRICIEHFFKKNKAKLPSKELLTCIVICSIAVLGLSSHNYTYTTNFYKKTIQTITSKVVHHLDDHTFINNEKTNTFYKTNIRNLAEVIAWGIADLNGNVTTPWIQATFDVSQSFSRSPNILCTGLTCFTISNPTQVTDADANNFATITFPTVSLSASATLRVTEANDTYPGGVFTGFTIERIGGLVSLGLLDEITIRTYLNGTLQESKNGNSLLDVSLLGGGSPGKMDIGFWTEAGKDFDAVELHIAPTVSANLGTQLRVYHALLEKAEAGTTPLCNVGAGSNWVKPTYPVRINDAATGTTGVCVSCTIFGASNIIDDDLDNFANISVLAGLAGGAQIAVLDPLVASYDAGSFAGFVVQDQGANLGLNLLDAFIVETYLDGSFQESNTSIGLIDLPIFASKNTVGFNTSLPFDEVRFRVVSLLGLNVNINVYQALLAPPGCILIDSDNDGITDDVEDAAPNNGDGNNDGTPDREQSSVASLLGTDGIYVTAEVSGTCDQIQSIFSLTEEELPNPSPQYIFPYGLIDIEIACSIPGGSANVVYYWHARDLTGMEYIKEGPMVPGESNRDFYAFPTAILSTIIDNSPILQSTLVLGDGLLGDDTVVDGLIKDPSGFANPVVYPGGVSPNLTFWLKADAGLDETDGQTVDQWDNHFQNLSVPNVSQSTANLQPIFDEDNANFNPTVVFDGQTHLVDNTVIASEIMSATDNSMFIVANHRSGAVWTQWQTLGAERLGMEDAGNTIRFDFPSSSDITNGISTTPNTFVLRTGQSSLINNTVYFNGLLDGTLARINNMNLALTGELAIGVSANNHSFGADADIAEVIMYDASLNSLDREKVETYLALKYGISLAHNYVASDGTTLFYNLTETDDLNIYSNDIAGIARDNAISCLYQTQSKSVNTDAILTMGLETIDATNQANILNNPMTDATAMVWGNNDGAATWTSITAPASYEILSRQWRIQETGVVGAVSLQFEVDAANFDVPNLQSGTDYYLIYDSNNNDLLSDETPIALTNSSGSTWTTSANIDFADGTEFTLATELCLAGTIAPLLASNMIVNVCPDTEADLDALHIGITPANTSLIWSEDNDASDGLSSTETSPTGNEGTYYAYYYDAVNDCYSPNSIGVTVTIITCNAPPSIDNFNSDPTASIDYLEVGTGDIIDYNATDPNNETENGGGLIYTLSGVDVLLFNLDINTGILRWNNPPDYETPLDLGMDNIYNVRITVSDLLLGMDTQDLAIRVIDLDEDNDGYINDAEPDDNDPCNPDPQDAACQTNCDAVAPTIIKN